MIEVDNTVIDDVFYKDDRITKIYIYPDVVYDLGYGYVEVYNEYARDGDLCYFCVSKRKLPNGDYTPVYAYSCYNNHIARYYIPQVSVYGFEGDLSYLFSWRQDVNGVGYAKHYEIKKIAINWDKCKYTKMQGMFSYCICKNIDLK